MIRNGKAERERHIRTLEERLNNGYELIDKRRAAGLDVTKLEDFWIALLHEYEQAVDDLDTGTPRKGAA